MLSPEINKKDMADLKDYQWALNGVQTIQDFTMNNPHFKVARVDYNAITKVARLELVFTEGVNGVNVVARDFSLPVTGTDEGLSKATVAGAISQLFPNAIQINP